MNSTLNFIDGHQISYAVAGACALFLFLLLLFELLRTRLYWIYEPRVHRDDYKSKTPPVRPVSLVRRGWRIWSSRSPQFQLWASPSSTLARGGSR